MTEAVAIGKYTVSLEVRFSANDTVCTFALTAHPRHLILSAKAESLRSSLHGLERLLKEHALVMSSSIRRSVNRANEYGAVFAEVDCRTSAWNEQEIDT